MIETVPADTPLIVLMNGRELGITEVDPEFAFSHWGQRQKRRPRRRYSLLSEHNGTVYQVVDGDWVAI